MPRLARTTGLKLPHLVIAYANGEGVLFREPEDYESYLERLRQLVRDKLLTVYAFCLQKNEIRLAVIPQKLPIARVIQRLHGSHSARMNRKYGLKGHLFRERFTSFLIPQSELHAVIRSIHLRPVRLGIVRRTELYPYSSHAGYVSAQSQWKDMLARETILAEFSPHPLSAQRAFERYVESAALDEDELDLSESQKAFANVKDEKPKRRVSLQMLAKRVSLLLNVNMSHLNSPSRRQDLVMARRLFSCVAVISVQRTVTEVADFLQRDKAQVSRLISQGIDLLDADEPFKALYEAAKGRYASFMNAGPKHEEH